MKSLGRKLRLLRKGQKLSLRQLAQKVGCAPSYLSMVENGKVDPSISRLKGIAEGLGTTIRELFQEPSAHQVVIRANERQHVQFPASRLRIELLVPQLPAKLMDARLARVAPGGGSEGDYHHPGEEFGLMLAGELELTVNGETYRLVQGDSFYFPSPQNHSFKNRGAEEAAVLWVNCPPSW
jgi:transcriptional regulator with XRE-family HTH domain